jgi:hypothetical protein
MSSCLSRGDFNPRATPLSDTTGRRRQRPQLQAAHASGVGQLVHMSSVGIYAPGSYGKPVNESWPRTGIASSPYSRDKSAAEALLDEYEQRLGSAAIPVADCVPVSSCSELRPAG